jgi:hypothetical protein
MTRYFLLLIFVIPAIGFISCTKFNSSGSAALSIVNAIDSNSYLITDFEPGGTKGNSGALLQYFATANQIFNGSSWESGSFVGSLSISLFQGTDTVNSLWSGTFNLAPGSIHTLFLSGDTVSVDTLFTTDLIPYYASIDSVAGVRFVNLSRGSLPISVDLQGSSPTQYEFSNLTYRQISGFKQYTAGSNAPPAGYTFEIRDQQSGNLLTTISWSYSLFKNNTIVVGGSENPNTSTPIQAFQVNNY